MARTPIYLPVRQAHSSTDAGPKASYFPFRMGARTSSSVGWPMTWSS